MYLANTSKNSGSRHQLVTPPEIDWPRNVKTTRPQLSMIWVKEFDGKREYLVAKWVRDNRK